MSKKSIVTDAALFTWDKLCSNLVHQTPLLAATAVELALRKDGLDIKRWMLAGLNHNCDIINNRMMFYELICQCSNDSIPPF